MFSSVCLQIQKTLFLLQETQLQKPLHVLQELLLLGTQMYQPLEEAKGKQSDLPVSARNSV